MNMVTIEEKVTVGEVGNSLRVVIPKTIAKALGIEKGDVLLMRTTNGDIQLVREAPSPRKKR